MKITDKDLVTELRNRNEKALYLLIDTYGSLIKRIIRKHMQHSDSWDECMDDILLSIWNNINSYCEDKNSFINWIAAISKYKSIDYQRKYQRVLNKYANKEIDSLPDTISSVNNELSIETERLLSHLNPTDRQLFLMHYVKDWSVDEISEKIGVKQSWIYNRLSRGRQKLRGIFNGMERHN